LHVTGTANARLARRARRAPLKPWARQFAGSKRLLFAGLTQRAAARSQPAPRGSFEQLPRQANLSPRESRTRIPGMTRQISLQTRTT